MVTLGIEREIYQHDAVLLDDADQQDDADQRDHAQVEMKGHEQQHCADAGGGQGREDGDRMDHALIEYSEDEIYDDQGGGDQNRRARERRLERLSVALKTRG